MVSDRKKTIASRLIFTRRLYNELGATNMPSCKFTIRIQSVISSEDAEEMEEKIRDLLRENGIDAIIDDSLTGNTTTTGDRDDG